MKTELANEQIIAFRNALPGPNNPYQLRKRKKLLSQIDYALERMPSGTGARERWERNREALVATISKGVASALGKQRPRGGHRVLGAR